MLHMAWFRHVYGIVALAVFLAVEIQAQDLTLLSRPPNVTYVELGKTLTLNVTYKATKAVSVTWLKGSTALFTTGLGSDDPRVSIKGQASLVLVNTTSSDNQTYTITLASLGAPSVIIKLIAIIQEQPTAVINCSSSSPVPVKEGDHFNCLCNSTGGSPPPAASWYKDGKVVSGPGYLKTTLSLENITGNDTGNYSCVVESHDLNDTKSVEIEVLLKPTAVTNCSTNVTVKEGDDLECLCYGTGGNPRPTASWYKDGRKVSVPEYFLKTLSLMDISKEDAGTYSCIVNNSAFQNVKHVQIHVLHKPTAKINCSTAITVNETEEVQCLCYSKGGNPRPNASWYKDGKKVDGSGYLKKTLSLKNITKNGGGNYSCVVNNTVFEDVEQVEIQVRYKPEINYFKSDQKNDMAAVGKSVKITCKADAFPPPDYKIFHNSIELADVINGVKTIMSVNYNDSGQYKCIAKNSRGNMFQIFNLTVKELKRPNASVNCSSLVTKNRGDEFACLCVGNGGYPPPTASWFKDGKNVSGRGYLNETLSLKNISKTDKGTYSCVVDSYGLNDTEEIEIQVQYEPENISFKSNWANNMVTVGNSITITCKADAFPSPNYTILHNGENLKDVLNGVKTFNSVELSDEGSYNCTAKNFLGIASDDLKLNVNGLPILVIVVIIVGSVVFVILLVVLIRCVYKRSKSGGCCPKKERVESEVDLADHGIPNVAVAVHDNFNAYESVDKEKMKPNEEAGTSGDGEPARVDSPPSMPPVNAVGEGKSMKKKTPPDEEKPASGEDDNATPAAAPSILPAVYTAVDKVAQQKERDAKPAPLTYANLDPVLLQPNSSKMRDRGREDTNYATIDMAKLQ